MSRESAAGRWSPSPPQAPKVKVCGITRYADARLALDCGAWALGLIFHRASPRYIEPDAARALVARLPPGTRTVGVFVDRPSSEIQELIDHVGLAGVQFHGQEPPADVLSVQVDLRIKAFRVGEGFDRQLPESYPDCLILLDTYRKGLPGGTGEVFDWSIARAVSQQHPVVLSGGIGPDNVHSAIQTVQPYGIDSSSRLEAAPGVKDPAKVKLLFEKLG